MENSFWQDTSRYGVIHRGSTRSKTLLVFVHGLFGDAAKTWARMPGWILDASKRELDIISYDYPSKLWQRCDIITAAHDLRTWLDTEFADYRHVIFVTHSTGGIVLKHCMNEAYGQLTKAVSQNVVPLNDPLPLWLRTRHVLNISVPHRGGSRILTGLTVSTYLSIYPILAPFLALVRLVSQGKYDWGRNGLISSLRHNHPWLIELDDVFHQCKNASEACDLPTPVVHDIFAQSDQAVQATQVNRANRAESHSNDATQRESYIRGTHKSVKIPRRASGPIVRMVADVVGCYQDDIAITITERSLLRVFEINQSLGVSRLIQQQVERQAQQPDQRADTEIPQFAQGRTSGTQQQICDALLSAIQHHGETPQRHVVTGASGVGKSTVMRMLVWQLSRAYLNHPANYPLPLFVPLQQITVDKASDPSYSWTTMWEWWLQWVQSLYPDERCSLSWLESKFQNHPVVVIMDGLDDFLVKHPGIGLSTVVNRLREVQMRYASNPALKLVIGIRHSLYGYERLASDLNKIYWVERLSMTQAMDTFPQSKDWLPLVKNRGLLSDVLTPFVLTNYCPTEEEKLCIDTFNKSHLMERILETFVERSQLIGSQTRTGEEIELEHVLAALALIAWLFFCRSRGEVSTDDLQQESAIIISRWQAFFGSNPGYQAQQILAGFQLVRDPGVLNAIAKHTVFSSSGPKMIRFTHRSWQEYLLAKFFLFCIRHGYYDDLGDAKLYSAIYRIAGQNYEEHIISADQVSRLLETWRSTGNNHVANNFIGFLSWTRIPADAQAIQQLVDQLDQLQSLPRLIMIGGLGYRIMVNDPDDHSLSDMRRILFPKLIQYANLDTAPVDDPLASSIAWCYQTAFSKLFSLAPPTCSWPELGFDDQTMEKVLPILTTQHDTGLVLDDNSRALQQAFIPPILDVFEYNNFLIRAIHYIYCLVAAKHKGLHCLAVSHELPSLLVDNSQFESIVHSFAPVPELSTLLQRCRTAFYSA